ncbi:hypothetical protein [Pollutimonas bauzanensis]|nr:hypothetical protein [Pollutimonas bauzanensis]
MLFFFLVGSVALMIWMVDFRKEMLYVVAGALIWPLLGLISWGLRENGFIGKRLSPQVAEALKDGQEIAETAERISSIYFGPFALGFVALLFVGTIGYWTAKLDTRAWVIDDQPTFILVRKYDDAYIFKEYDPKTMKVGDRVQIVSLGDSKKLSLKPVVLKGFVARFGSSTPRDTTENSAAR